MTAVDSMKGQVGGFQSPGVCLRAFPSLLPHPLSALLLVPFFVQSSTLVPGSLLLNRTETLAMQATYINFKRLELGPEPPRMKIC